MSTNISYDRGAAFRILVEYDCENTLKDKPIVLID